MSYELKKAAAKAALNFVKDTMIVGLGSGTTAELFIEFLIDKVQVEKWDIKVIASSERTFQIAKRGKLNLKEINEVDNIDIVVDGADEIDDQKRMIKGGGGALLREKILAQAAKKMVVIVDSSKCVAQLGKGLIPVEVSSFGYKFTQEKLQKEGFKSSLRLNENKLPFLTDNKNYILDLSLDKFFAAPKPLHEKISSVVGVLETGIFFELDPIVIVAHSATSVKIID